MLLISLKNIKFFSLEEPYMIKLINQIFKTETIDI